MEWAAFFKSLLRRNTVVVFLVLLAWLLILDLIWLLPTQQSLRSSASELSLQVADSAGARINAELENVIARVQNAELDIRAEPQRTPLVLARLLERNTSFTHVVIVDRNGQIITHAGNLSPNEVEPDYSKMSNFYLTLAGTSNFSGVTVDTDGSPIAYATTPIRDSNGSVTGALLVRVRLTGLENIVKSVGQGSWRAYITDTHGTEIIGKDVVAGNQPALFSRPIVQKVAIDGETANGLASTDPYVTEGGVEMFAVGEPIQVTNWSLFVERPKKDALAQVRVVTLLAGVIFVLGTCSILVALWSIWRLRLLNDRLSAQEKELRDKNTQLQELDRIKSDFISVAAHQLRTPLSALKWILGILTDESSTNLTVEQRGLLFKGVESNERMVNLINEMLVVTRIESGKERFAFVPLHAEDLIENTLIDFAGQAHVRKIDLNFDRPPERLGYISADPQKMRDVLQNLIENAMRYTLDGGKITVRAVREGTHIHVSVADTGIGIPEHQKANIFNKFFRADNAMKLITDGSGLGLFIAKSIVEKHGGTLSFESAEGKGTIFHIRLPMSTDEDAKVS